MNKFHTSGQPQRAASGEDITNSGSIEELEPALFWSRLAFSVEIDASHSHYERWVELFCDTIEATFQGPRAEIAKGRGRKMAAAMERLLSGVSASGMAPIEPVWRRIEGA